MTTALGIGGFTTLLDDSFIFERLTEKDYPKFVTQTIRILGGNSGLRLIFASKMTESCFMPEQKIVKIPPPPPFPRKEKSKKKFFKDLAEWRGVLNHEVGHARYTLWSAKKIENVPNKKYHIKHHAFVDLFENGRMERVACEDYPGMLPDLQKLQGALGREIKKFQKKDSKHFNHLYYAMRMAVNGYKPATEIPAKLNKDWDKCMEFVREAWETNDEPETIEIAKKVQKYLEDRMKEEIEKAKERKKEKAKKEDELKEIEKEIEEAANSVPNLSKDPEDMETKKTEGGEEEEENKEESEEGKGEGKEGEEEDEKEEGKGKGKGEENDKEENDEEGEGEKSEKEIAEEKLEELKEKAEELKKDLEDIKEEEEESPDPMEMDPTVVEIIDPMITIAKKEKPARDCYYGSSEDVVPMPLDDYVENHEVTPDKPSNETNETLSEIMGSVAGMAQRFIQKVRSSRHVGSRTYQGRVSNRHLHKFKFSKNIFKTENMRKKKGASVMIVVDCSGSMSHHKINTALKSALVMGEIMYQAKVEFEVVGFTVFCREFDFGAFTRTANLQHYRFGSNKDWQHRKHGIINAANENKIELADNDDGESLRQFASEIAKSKKERKMMVVISDGIPMSSAQIGDTSKDLHQAIKEIRDDGTEIYAVGLNTNVGKFYGDNKSVRINASCKTEELVTALAKFIGLVGNG